MTYISHISRACKIDTKAEFPDESYLTLRSSDAEEARSASDLSQFLYNIGIRDFVVEETREERSSGCRCPLTALLAFLLIVFTLAMKSARKSREKARESKERKEANLIVMHISWIQRMHFKNQTAVTSTGNILFA